jgi:hypothetical protein
MMMAMSSLPVLLLLLLLCALYASRADGCVCTALYAPVCGSNERTYSNACAAKCDSVAVVEQGPCSGGGGAGSMASNCSDCSNWSDRLAIARC